MMKFFAVVVFFITFYRVSVYFSFAYISFVFGFIGLLLMFDAGYRSRFFSSLGPMVPASIFVLAVFSFFIDFLSGALLTNFTNTFFVRTVSMVLISILPAYFLCSILLRGDYNKALSTISIAFWVQLLFWVATFLIPGLKVLITQFMGGSLESVNLREYNMNVRGFGISGEINYTTPFMTVLVCLLFLRTKTLSVFSTLTQLINSNLVLVAAAIGVFFSRLDLNKKVALVLVALICLLVLGEVFFPRFFDEFKSGDSRTVNILIDNHLVFINSGFLGHLFGEFAYVFQGGASVSSDIGWVHLYNYGGVVFTLLFLVFLCSVSVAAFGVSRLGLVWFLSGIVLNTKGLLFSPNAYYFMTFIFIFLNRSPNIRKC